MLAELAAANAAFAVIKQTVSHGKDLMSAGKAISKLVDAEEDLRARGNKKKNSFWGKIGKQADVSDIEEFMALEQIKQKRAELESAMKLYGRAGLHSDWVRFQVEARKRRQQEAEERKRKKQQMVEVFLVTVLCAVIGLGLIWLLWMISLGMRS
ncbi:MAG: hypothetical protein VW715_02035 [Rhodospirillales bacterium]